MRAAERNHDSSTEQLWECEHSRALVGRYSVPELRLICDVARTYRSANSPWLKAQFRISSAHLPGMEPSWRGVGLRTNVEARLADSLPEIPANPGLRCAARLPYS